MNPFNASPKPPGFMSQSFASVLPRMLAHDALSLAGSSSFHDAPGQQACLDAWDRVRSVPAAAWRALPRSREEWDDVPGLSAARVLGGCIPYAAIAREVEHALDHGTRSRTALACMLLASIALEWDDGGNAASALADAALDLAAQPGQSDGGWVRVMHASLVVARTAGLVRAVDLLEALRKDPALPVVAHLHWASTAFAAGMPLNELLHDLQQVHDRQHAGQLHASAHTGLALRLCLISTLCCPAQKSSSGQPGSTGITGKNTGPADWLARLQASWYAGNVDDALNASRRAARSIGSLTPVADVLCYHLFSVLALGRSNATHDVSGIDGHCFVLARLACACPGGAAAIAELASAVRDRRAGKTLAALHGVERACDLAARAGQHWVAALASEEAALAASNAGLGSAAAHYRQQALASYRRWGALGRVDMLVREWGSTLAMQEGELVLSIAHELNQPLAAIALHSSAARKWLGRAEPNVERALASLGLISEAGRHAGDIIRGMQRLAAHHENEFGDVAVDQTIRDTLHTLQQPLREHGIELELALNLGSTAIRANRAQFQQVLTNLLVNAIEALSGIERPQGPRRIRIASRPVPADEVDITIEDNGPGIAPVNRPRVFGHRFTTKPDNTGLGLPISLAIVRAHHGHIGFEPRTPRGACFRVRFPVRGPQSQVAMANDIVGPLGKQTRT